MSTGITFGSYHTSDDLGLSMTDTPPNVGTPQIYEKYIDVPGGLPIDASEYPGGSLAYNNREMSFEFAKKNDDMSWPRVVSKVMNAIHGKRMDIVLDDDRAWKYNGRVKVQAPNLVDNFTKLTVNATALPYKEYARDLKDPWVWDETDFDSDELLYDNGLTDIALDGSAKTIVLPKSVYYPEITVTLTVTGFSSGATSGYLNVSGSTSVYSSTGTYTRTKTVVPDASQSVYTTRIVGTLTISYTPRSF
jgi:hypothetical protein